MKTYNWKYLRNGKKIIFALCRGDRLIREYSDINMAWHREKDTDDKFKNSIDDFMKKQKQIIEEKQTKGETDKELADEGYRKFINYQKKTYDYDPNGEQIDIFKV